MRTLKICLIAAFSIVACFGAPVESAKSTIFILLGTAGGSVTNSSQMWESTGIRKFIQDNIAKEAIHLYVAEYDIAKMSPSVFVDEHLAGKAAAKSVLLQAQTDWFDKSQDSAIKSFRDLEDLRQSRPDLVPSRYILIAEGAAGLAVREYIQGENYKGEFSNVLFFNTPHEGDVVYVTIEEEGHYVLEIVDAAGMPLRTLFNGTWSEGEHSLTLIGRNMNPGNYLVLRRDNVILSWQILK